ncbi:low specificity L-threonine aldolase [Atopobium sp. oral taxon 416]|uniref:threonine aldolase family protein n=1 Tax=Atopobium sp. oral taxon 416 TaxID=712157 RepID=UPI001BA6CE1E|nr:beta-eliminating lyase-related protein [Atopobium sp. oral taxon 416]QUC02762.1 hypothetical protein J4859_12190 [Atopobium sp. oral taxon 416]
MRMFQNDYSEDAASEILVALCAANFEQRIGYTEGDPHCEEVRKLIREACEDPTADVEFRIGGTSTNIVALNGLLKDWEGIICTPDVHIAVHETGALVAVGRTVLPTHDKDGFLSPEEAERVSHFQTSTDQRMAKPGAVYIINTTELGGVWTKQRFDAICDWADEHQLPVFLDEARLASASAAPSNDLTLPHIAKRCTAFYLGGTKNGMLCGEALVINDPKLKEAFPYLIKERDKFLAKGRLLGVQFERTFMPEDTEPLWFPYTCQANDCAIKMRESLIEEGYKPYGDSNFNQQFFVVTSKQAEASAEACGCETFYTLKGGRQVIRFVTSWATTESNVDEVLTFAKQVIA